MFTSQHRQRLYTRVRNIVRRRLALRTTLGGDGRGGGEAGSRLLFGENYTGTAKRVPGFGTRGGERVARAVRIKAAQTKPRGREPRRETGCGDPNFYAREQILESDAPARAARVKMRVRIQLKLCHRTGNTHKRESECPAFFSRTRPQCLSLPAAFARLCMWGAVRISLVPKSHLNVTRVIFKRVYADRSSKLPGDNVIFK